MLAVWVGWNRPRDPLSPTYLFYAHKFSLGYWQMMMELKCAENPLPSCIFYMGMTCLYLVGKIWIMLKPC